MRHEDSVYSAKILLFGEYSVIFDSRALTIPYSFFNGHLSFIDEDKYTRYDMAIQSNAELMRYYQFFVENRSLAEIADLDTDRLLADLKSGLYFESNIPQGFGVGSSGALVAAVYDRYSCSRIIDESAESLKKLKYIFSLMESYFHGTSSGMDPLNCYIGEPLLFSSNDKIRKVTVPHHENDSDGAIFLINSGYPSTTEPLVKMFLRRTLEKSYKQLITGQIIPLTDKCIELITGGNLISFFEQLSKLSALQMEAFQAMIPSRFLPLWQRGLSEGEFYLKLCGSGGGGFLLGFTWDYHSAENIMKKEGIEIMPVFKNSSFRTSDDR
jgi:mevalonate kinase